MENYNQEPFDADAILNKLYDCTRKEIPWASSHKGEPDYGHKYFSEWLTTELSRVRQEAREKAIEECLEHVPVESEWGMNQYRFAANQGGDYENFKYGYFMAYKDIHGFLSKLK